MYLNVNNVKYVNSRYTLDFIRNTTKFKCLKTNIPRTISIFLIYLFNVSSVLNDRRISSFLSQNSSVYFPLKRFLILPAITS